MFWDGVLGRVSSGRWGCGELWPLCGLWLVFKNAFDVVVGTEVSLAGVVVEHF